MPKQTLVMQLQTVTNVCIRTACLFIGVNNDFRASVVCSERTCDWCVIGLKQCAMSPPAVYLYRRLHGGHGLVDGGEG